MARRSPGVVASTAELDQGTPEEEQQQLPAFHQKGIRGSIDTNAAQPPQQYAKPFMARLCNSRQQQEGFRAGEIDAAQLEHHGVVDFDPLCPEFRDQLRSLASVDEFDVGSHLPQMRPCNKVVANGAAAVVKQKVTAARARLGIC